jgi:hypothetical protein
LCWPKNIVKKDVAAPSLLLNNIESFELSERRWRGFKSEPMLQKSFSKQDEESFLAAPLPGELPKQYSPGDSKKNLKVSIERMTAFAQSKWRLVAPPLESEQIDLELIKKWLSEYPNANAVAAMTEEDYQEVLGFVLNKQETVEKLAERKRRIEEERQGDQWKQKILEKVMNRVRNMELEDINEFVTVKGKFDEDQSIVKIAGTKEEISNGNVMIRGTGEANQNDEKMVVKSLHQIQNNKTGNFTTEDKQVWNDAKKKIETELAEKFKQIEGNTEDEFEALLGQQLETVLSDQAGIESEFSNIIATEVLDDSMIQLVNEKYDEPVPKNVNSQHLELSIEKLTKQLTTKDSQLERLRSLLAQLKTRVDMLTSEGGVNKNKVLQVQNQQLNDILEKKNQEILKLKSNQPIHSQATDEQVKNLLEEIEDLKSQQQVKNDPNGEELRKIQKNYRSLEKENEILRMRFKALSEKVDQQRQQMQDTRSSDLNALNEQKELGNRQVEKLSRELNKSRQKEDDLSALLEQKNYEVTQLRDNQNGNVGKEAQNSIQDAFKQSLMEKDLQITKANVELKSLREQNEQNIHQIKVLENKIKLGQGQKPSSMTDVAAQQSKQATQDGKLAQLQHRLKQSEKLFAKLDEASKKMQIDLTEKKKESLNLRQENSILKNKMAELERKLGPQKKTG